jgi:serine/threonine protein kinase
MPQSDEQRLPPVLGKGRFVVCDHLGDGGTAGVYLAWDRQQKLWCALKAMLSTHLKDDDMRGRFRAEAETMERLAHPFIPRLLAHDIDATPPFLVMELARCGSAMAWVKKNGPMPAGMVVDVLVQMCDALSHAHAHGVVHRDVKPHNFLLDEHGVAKLTDFGIARVDDATSMTATGSQIGTFSFMAPEQRANTKTVDERADVYAMGASLYTMLSARTSAELFIAEDDDALLDPVPEQFRPVIIRACAYKKEDRYPSILEMQTAMLTALSRFPSSDMPAPPLVEVPPPLPAGPPRFLPSGVAFDDLYASMALDLDQPTWVPSPAARKAQEQTAAGSPTPVPVYSMSRPAPSPMGTSGLPSYLDQSEVKRETKREADFAAAKAIAQAKATPAPARNADDQLGSRVLEAVIYGSVALVAALVLMVAVSGAWVALARSSCDTATEQFTGVLMNEGAVVYDLGGDRRFEELYAAYVDATGPAKVAAAIGFADALERASDSQRGQLDAKVAARVDRILASRDAYTDAYDRWSGRANGFPGSIAVAIGLVAAP